MNSRNIVVALIIVLAIGVGGYLAWAFMTNPGSTPEQTTPAATDQKDSAQTPSTVAIETDKVDISNFAYSPEHIKIKKGTTVTWTNKDTVGHTVTFTSSDLQGSELLQKDGQFSFTFNAIGIFNYFCKPHPAMKGSVEVVE